MTGLFTTILALVELVKYAMKKLGNTDDKYFNAKDREKLNELLDMHNKFDQDGNRIWYVPRSWAEVQKDIVNICKENTAINQSIAKTLERLESKIK